MWHRHSFAVALVTALAFHAAPAAAMKLTPAMIELFSAVEMPPPSASHMTVCYGFRCQRRMELVFTAAERTLLMNTLAKGKASPAEILKAIEAAVVGSPG